MSTVTLMFPSANRRLQEPLLHSIYVQKNHLFFYPQTFYQLLCFCFFAVCKIYELFIEQNCIAQPLSHAGEKKEMGSYEVYQSELI